MKFHIIISPDTNAHQLISNTPIKYTKGIATVISNGSTHIFNPKMIEIT